MRNAYLKNHKDGRRLPLARGAFDIENVPGEVVDSLTVDRELLQSALNDLPDGYKLVVLCFYFEDLSYREIAERLETDPEPIAEALGAVHDRSIGRWRRDLTAEQADDVEREAGTLLRELGYA